MGEKTEGTWIPRDVFMMWETLRLDSSTWNVLLAMANQQYRYGGGEARITLHVVAKRTGHSLSTVKRSVAKLQDVKQLVKLGRGRWQLVGVNMVTPIRPPEQKRERVNMVTPSKGHDHGPFAILLFSIVKDENNSDEKHPFTIKQIRTLNSVIHQVSELFNGKVMALTVPNVIVGQAPATYESWLRTIVANQDKKGAQQFVGTMLKLLDDERIIGRELK